MIQQFRPNNGTDPQQPPTQKRPLDPLITLQVALDHHASSAKKTPMGTASSRTSIASVCFLPHISGSCQAAASQEISGNDNHGENSDSDDSDSSDSDEEDFSLKCRQILQPESSSTRGSSKDPTSQARQTAASLSLAGRYLASCHANGEVLLWDLGQRCIKRQQQEEWIDSRGPGWMLRRIEHTTQIIYQTRDPEGIVSLHDMAVASSSSSGSTNKKNVVASLPTYSQTFCSAAPCSGNHNLLALPSEEDSDVTIRDLRMDPSSRPVAMFPGADVQEVGERKHGMLTSLAFSESSSWSHNHNLSRPVVACGMESGTVFFHDMAMLGKPESFKLSNDPVLALDMAPSHVTTAKPTQGVVAIAGMAGEAVEMRELPKEEQGTIALLKTTIQQQTPQDSSEDTGQEESSTLRVRLRSRLHTCQPTGDGKPGVNLIRFQPGREQRFFAVGGWDKRLRIMDRAVHANNKSQSALKAILRGHLDSVKALDWAPDSETSGLLATGAGDGKIHIWKCFSKTT